MRNDTINIQRHFKSYFSSVPYVHEDRGKYEYIKEIQKIRK